MKEYLEAAQSRLDSDGEVAPIKVKIERSHFDWLTYRQVKGMTADEILEAWSEDTDDKEEQHYRRGLTAQGVNKAINEAATLAAHLVKSDAARHIRNEGTEKATRRISYWSCFCSAYHALRCPWLVAVTGILVFEMRPKPGCGSPIL